MMESQVRFLGRMILGRMVMSSRHVGRRTISRISQLTSIRRRQHLTVVVAIVGFCLMRRRSRPRSSVSRAFDAAGDAANRSAKIGSITSVRRLIGIARCRATEPASLRHRRRGGRRHQPNDGQPGQKFRSHGHVLSSLKQKYKLVCFILHQDNRPIVGRFLNITFISKQREPGNLTAFGQHRQVKRE